MLGEAIDGAVGKITTGIVIAGAIVGLAVYARPAPPRYDAFAVGEPDRPGRSRAPARSSPARAQQTCQLVLRKGQRLTRIKRTDALPAPAAATPLPAAPAAGK